MSQPIVRAVLGSLKLESSEDVEADLAAYALLDERVKPLHYWGVKLNQAFSRNSQHVRDVSNEMRLKVQEGHRSTYALFVLGVCCYRVEDYQGCVRYIDQLGRGAYVNDPRFKSFCSRVNWELKTPGYQIVGMALGATGLAAGSVYFLGPPLVTCVKKLIKHNLYFVAQPDKYGDLKVGAVLKFPDCDDGGVEFIEASNDNRLEDFIIFKKEQDDDENTRQLAQLIPKGLGPHLVEVQLTHFACGGVALTVSISHKVADGLTAANFLVHWATVTRGGSPKSPIFISFPISNAKLPAYAFQTSRKNKYVTKRFMFPNSKVNKLKNKINAISSTTTPLNPTRVESLTSLLFKCAVDASAIKPTSLQPLELNQLVNMRNKLVPNLSNLAAGNIITAVSAKIVDSSQMKLNEIITLLRQELMQVKEVTSIQEVGKHLENTMLNFKNDINRAYSFTSMCRFPFYEVDFGWGKPVKVTTQTANGDLNMFSLMDTPHGDGIEAIVHMKEEDMAIFREDKELLAYVENI